MLPYPEPEFDEIVIEINERRTIKRTALINEATQEITEQPDIEAGNGEVQFPIAPILDNLRSRYLVSRETGDTAGPMLKMPEIPGMYVCLNVEKRVGRIIDPLGFGEGKKVLERVKAICRTMTPRNPGFRSTESQVAVPPRVVDNLSEEDVQTWLYWMRRFLNTEGGRTCANAIQNCEKIPTVEEIVATKKVRKPFQDLSIYRTTEADKPEKGFYTEEDIRNPVPEYARR